MAKSRKQKEIVLDSLTDSLKKAKGAALATFSGLKVQSDRAFRSKLFQEGITYSVVKKTLLKKVFSELQYPAAELDQLQGNISIAISDQDEIAPAKALDLFIKDNQTVTFVGGILEARWIGADKVKALSQLPNRETLIAKTIGTIKAPVSGLVNVLAGNLRGLVTVLKAVQEKK